MRASTLLVVLLIGAAGCASPTVAVADVRDEAAPGQEQEKKAEAAPEKKDKREPFRLPADDVGKMLAKVLPPAARPTRDAARPTPSAPPPVFAAPPDAAPPLTVEVARLPAGRRNHVMRPQVAAEERLGDFGGPVSAPRVPSFVTGRPVRIMSEDVAIPPPLPPMATAVPDRVPLEDATLEFSTAAVIAAQLPRREAPVPFTRAAVPDPFEHRGPPVAPPEEAVPR